MTRSNSRLAEAMRRKLVQVAAVNTLLLAAMAASAQDDEARLDENVGDQIETNNAAQQSQAEVSELDADTQDEAARYAQALAEAETLERYNATLSEQVAMQETEIASINQQLVEIETTTREVQPLMERMVATLEQFIALDVPFLIQERTQRIATLKETMNRADAAISEKYRLILEAYQIELEYGSTLEAYEGRLGTGEDARTVEFVRLGRISLMYQTLDGSETGYWDANTKSWVEDSSYAEAVEQALRVARREGAPELLTVPVPAPQEARS